jgi:HK97 family phage prohead protease
MTDDALRIVTAGDVAIRGDADGGDGRTISGYAYRWGELTEVGGAKETPTLREGFERGAFLPAIAERQGRPWPYLDVHRGNTVAGITLSEDDIGLRYEGRLLDTQAAREYAATVPPNGPNDGVSLEFLYRGAKSKRVGGAIIHTAIQRIAALAGEYVPAYRGATVALREDGGTTRMAEAEDMTTTTDEQPAERTDTGLFGMTRDDLATLVRETATEVVRGMAERGSFTPGPARSDPFAGYRNLGELMAAAFASRGDEADPNRGTTPGRDDLRSYAARALADVVFTAGANAALASGNLVTSDIKRIVNGGRPAITAFGGPRGLGDTAGLTLEWPYFDGTLTDYVAAQSAEKAEIESATIDIKLDTEALKTYAGGADISYQVLRRGNPSVLDAFGRIMLAAWAVVTDAAFVTELESGSVTVDTAEAISAHDLAEFTADLVTASLAVQAASGQPADFVLASTTLFARLANLIIPSSTQIAGASNADIRGLSFMLGNVPIIHVPAITAGKGIVSNPNAAAWFEDGPFQVSAEDVAHLGRDVAFWSLGAGARFIPAAIVEVYDVTP